MRLGRLRLACKAGCRISIGTDSHGPSQLEFIEFALAAALKAKLDPNRILTFMGREELVAWAESVRDRHRAE
jgi:histidinol phosphatase-like PHP family hydrolase